MRLFWQPKAPRSLDHELLWLGVGSASIALGYLWLRFQLPFPGCRFHDLTGLPCATCGATRCIIQISHGNFLDAFIWNPIVFAAAMVAAVALLYCAAVVTFRLPRLRIAGFGGLTRRFLPWTLLLLLMLNWVYALWFSPKIY